MEEQIKTEKPQEQSVSGTSTSEKQYSASEYATAIKELKEKTVSKDDYNALKAEKSELIKALAEGKAYEVNTSTEDNRSSQELGEEIAKGKDKLNLQYVTKALAYRDQCLKEGKHDPFAPYSSRKATTREELETADRVATILKECVDNAHGDSRIFNGELERRMR